MEQNGHKKLVKSVILTWTCIPVRRIRPQNFPEKLVTDCRRSLTETSLANCCYLRSTDSKPWPFLLQIQICTLWNDLTTVGDNPHATMDYGSSYTLSLSDNMDVGVTNQSVTVTGDEVGNTSADAINTTEHHVVSWSFYIEVSALLFWPHLGPFMNKLNISFISMNGGNLYGAISTNVLLFHW